MALKFIKVNSDHATCSLSDSLKVLMNCVFSLLSMDNLILLSDFTSCSYISQFFSLFCNVICHCSPVSCSLLCRRKNSTITFSLITVVSLMLSKSVRIFLQKKENSVRNYLFYFIKKNLRRQSFFRQYVHNSPQPNYML